MVMSPPPQTASGEPHWARGDNLAQALDEAAIVAVTDPKGRITYCNDRFCEVSGFERNEIVGATHRIVNSGVHDRAFFQDLYSTIANRGVWRGTICNRRKTGEFYWVDTTIVPQLDDHGRIAAYVAIRFDVTSHMQALSDLAVARERMERASKTKDQFVANMSHEIRTPLNGVLGVAEALAKTYLQPHQHEMVDLIIRSGHTLERILNDVLDLSKMDAGRMKLELAPFDLRAEIRAAAELIGVRADNKGLAFALDFCGACEGEFVGDATRIKQIVSNLASNAVKFTEAGEVRVMVSFEPAENDPASGQMTIAVKDTGIGFDPAKASFLFQPFAQADNSIARRFGGTGLGLSICRSLAQIMGGDIAFESRLGEGSTFVVHFPLRRATETRQRIDEPDYISLIKDRQARVLLVEDHPTNQKVIELILDPFGVRLTLANNGVEALQRFAEDQFDCVLMDMQMPVMDGLTCLRALRSKERAQGLVRTPVAMLTANTSPEHRHQAHAAGADGFIAKPVSYQSVIRGVADLLGGCGGDACEAGVA
jgi:PAS domain S-box-containing protein